MSLYWRSLARESRWSKAKADRLDAAIAAVHGRGEYPSMARVARELGRGDGHLEDIEIIHRYRTLRRLGVKPKPNNGKAYPPGFIRLMWSHRQPMLPPWPR